MMVGWRWTDNTSSMLGSTDDHASLLVRNHVHEGSPPPPVPAGLATTPPQASRAGRREEVDSSGCVEVAGVFSGECPSRANHSARGYPTPPGGPESDPPMMHGHQRKEGEEERE